LDLQDEQENGPQRVEAIQHYKAAADMSADLPEAKAAAELGIQKPYEPPKNAQGQSHQDDGKD
jgi:hypothetical protein